MIDFKNIKRLTLKVGTSTLTYETGKLNFKRLDELARVLSDIQNRGIKVVLVTSGAIGVGAGKLAFEKKPETVQEKQAAAAIGQLELMTIYDKLFSQYGQTIAQVLLTKDIIEDGQRRENVLNTFEKLLEYGVIPVINENDTVSTEEIEFGDNDRLSAVVAELTKSELLIILTDTDGLFNKNPREHADAQLIPVVREITPEIVECAKAAGSKFGTGGMASKISAAQTALGAGVPVVITNGGEVNNIFDILDGKQTGTVFIN